MPMHLAVSKAIARLVHPSAFVKWENYKWVCEEWVWQWHIADSYKRCYAYLTKHYNIWLLYESRQVIYEHCLGDLSSNNLYHTSIDKKVTTAYIKHTPGNMYRVCCVLWLFNQFSVVHMTYFAHVLRNCFFGTIMPVWVILRTIGKIGHYLIEWNKHLARAVWIILIHKCCYDFLTEVLESRMCYRNTIRYPQFYGNLQLGFQRNGVYHLAMTYVKLSHYKYTQKKLCLTHLWGAVRSPEKEGKESYVLHEKEITGTGHGIETEYNWRSRSGGH